MAQLKLPIGIENFKKIRTEGYYYVDKTDVIRQVIEVKYTEEGKSMESDCKAALNMSMLRHFLKSVQTVRCFQVLKIVK